MNSPPHAGKNVKLKQLMTPKSLFVGGGTAVLTMLTLVPIWNASSLLNDQNYIFWCGKATPVTTIVLCIAVVLLYVVTMSAFFNHAPVSAQNEQSIMMIANIFITLLGLMLMFIALPLTHQAHGAYGDLMHHCDTSEQTHRMYEYSQVLQNIRQKPHCIDKNSVEECEGYEIAHPYTSFMQYMESEFRCSGFCYRTTGIAQAVKKNATLAKSQPKNTTSKYPPTLFSDANHLATCEGMAARDMKNFAGDVGFQTFYQGIYLVLISIATGFLKIIGFCTKKDKPEAQRDLMYGGPRL